MHLSNASFIKYQRDAIFSVYLVFYNSACFGRSLRPSSGVIFLQTVVAATYDTHQWLPLQFVKITPDDGRKLRSKHVEL